MVQWLQWLPLWLNLEEKDKAFLLYALISPSSLFGNAVNNAVDRYQLAAFKGRIPRSSG